MAGIFVATYKLQIHKTGAEDPSPNAFASGKTLYGEIKRIVDELCAGYARDDKEKQLLRARHRKLAAGAPEPPADGARVIFEGQNIFGTFERGEYGYASPFIKSDTLAPSIQRLVNDAEIVPYYFRSPGNRHPRHRG